jgi:hypothetical protein
MLIFLIGGIYELRHQDGLSWHEILSMLHSDVGRGDTQQAGFIILHLFFKITKVDQNRQFMRELCVCHINAKKRGEHRGCNIGRSDVKRGLKMLLVLPDFVDYF